MSGGAGVFGSVTEAVGARKGPFEEALPTRAMYLESENCSLIQLLCR